MADTDRIPPLEPPCPPDAAEVLARMTPEGKRPLALFRMFAHNVPMFDAMNAWGSYQLGDERTGGTREREIVIDRVCALCRAEYEWAVHVAFLAPKAELTEEQITSLTHGESTDPCWTAERDRLLIELTDATHGDGGDTDDAPWARLSAEFDRQELLDLLFLAGRYQAVDQVTRATRLSPEPGTPRFDDYLPQP
ncbi:carboxymuconolactone decarboxylase family protein [Streptomyces sp. NPDC041068]|uniref:carboxymuconolactone decarboxylase family protein n=1 Tax=Streptomyces sp. NPDC041068 TaxID=3155130 RepID=UPI0033F22E5E